MPHARPDIFVCNQHAVEELAPDFWSTTFKSAVASIGCTVLVLQPWQDPAPLKRAWCLWELLSTIEGKAGLHVVMSAAAEQEFKHALVRRTAHEIFACAAHAVHTAVSRSFTSSTRWKRRYARLTRGMPRPLWILT
jgi:hypothetical protein